MVEEILDKINYCPNCGEQIFKKRYTNEEINGKFNEYGEMRCDSCGEELHISEGCFDEELWKREAKRKAEENCNDCKYDPSNSNDWHEKCYKCSVGDVHSLSGDRQCRCGGTTISEKELESMFEPKEE